MANVNINRNLKDQFYRYKMPTLLAKVEGKGNGIKTVIVNMPEIAKSLNRPPMYPTKYFGCLLGAQVNFDHKSERYIVNGAHDPNKLQDLLDGFIQKYVLCQACENPETVLSVSKKKEVIGTYCQACGHSGTIPAANDRVAAYILKNPPPKSAAITAPTAAAAAAASDSAASGPVANHMSSKTNNDDDDDDWGEDTNEAAVRERMDQLSAGAKSLMLNDDLEKSQDERLNIFFEYIEKQVKTKVDLTVGENQKAIKAEAERLDISDKAVIVLCEVLFRDNLLEKVKLYKNLFLRFTNENPKAQKYLLRALEMTIAIPELKLLPIVANIFIAFYQHDIIAEEVFLEWFAKHQKRINKLDDTMKAMVEKARPFIIWLKEAPEESDEDEEEVDVDFDDRLVGDAIKVTDQDKKDGNNAQNNSQAKNASGNKEPAAGAPVAKSKPDEDELDIDAI